MDHPDYFTHPMKLAVACVLATLCTGCDLFPYIDRGLDDRFPISVWMQPPEEIHEGKTIAQHYKELGVNTFIGLWNWPSEHNMYPGYAVASMRALADAELKVYNGYDSFYGYDSTASVLASAAWIADHPEFDDTFEGYLLGDEADMKVKSGVAAEAAANTPFAWRNRGAALLAADSSRQVFANFGKPFAEDYWSDDIPDGTGTKAGDFAIYVAPATTISCDYYGLTDPYEAPSNHGIWTYGRSVDNARKYAGGRPVWGVLEASAPWKFASSNQMYVRMPPALVKTVVWNMVVHGAQGIMYFCHDFMPDADPDPAVSTNLGNFAALREPGIPAAMREANESVLAYAALLLSPSIEGTEAITDGPVGVTTLTKRDDDYIYVFAMGDGNAAFREGHAVNADITVTRSTMNGIVEILGEDRQVSIVGGKISDAFGPYGLHIYRISR